jgi:hypothetical protein
MDEPRRSTVEEHQAGTCRGYYGCTTCAEEIGRAKTAEAERLEGGRHRSWPLTAEERAAGRRAHERRRAKARAARKARKAQRRASR